MGADRRYTAVFELVNKGVRCDDVLKARAYCRDNPDCKMENAYKVECAPLARARPRYVSYYDCTDWNSNVEVMNLQDLDAKFIITLYRRNGSLVWQNTVATKPNETKRIQLDRYAPRDEGLVVVEPEKEGWEFPSMLCITNAKDILLPSGLGKITKTHLQRFVPFIRVP